jgi:carbon monoxide dehydrogenase subunit G
MDELTARLESLLRFYAGADPFDQGDGAVLAQQFSRDLQLLVAEFGPRAVDAALDKMPDGAWQAGSLH